MQRSCCEESGSFSCMKSRRPRSTDSEERGCDRDEWQQRRRQRRLPSRRHVDGSAARAARGGDGSPILNWRIAVINKLSIDMRFSKKNWNHLQINNKECGNDVKRNRERLHMVEVETQHTIAYLR
eukprot:6196703-Pleurochrysis_carterae.AAC.1